MRGAPALLRRFLPFLKWFDGYDLAALRADLVSGVTVALVLVPQSMAYAQLAGLPPYYGLYAAFLPPMVASLFGSSRQLATGPVAVVSLMTAATLEPLATAGSNSFVAYALLLSLLVGVFQLCLGALRLGLIVSFLSHPVVNGFTNAAALIIATSQLSKLFGVSVENASHHYETVSRVVAAAARDTHWPTFLMAALAITVMVVLRRVNRRIPNVLAAVALATVLSWAVKFDRRETVSLSRIKSPEAAQTIRAFNAAVLAKEQAALFRVESRKDLGELQDDTRQACVRCHGKRDASGFSSPPPASSPAANSGRLAVLHEMAGLLNEYLSAAKHDLSDYRARLRAMRFRRTAAGDGSAEFHLAGPGREAKREGVWRIQAGNSTIDTEALVLRSGGAVVGTIPAGLPAIRAPAVDWSILPTLCTAAMVISLLGFMEAISIANAMAARTKQKIDANQELIGQGLSNIVGSLSQSYPVSGSFSRSAVNLQSGGRTGFSNVVASVVVMAVLLFFSRWLYHLPQAVLAAVIIMAVVGLLNVNGFVHAWRTSQLDGAVSIATFLMTLLLAPHLEWGILLGVGLSVGAYFYRTMRPRIADLAPHPDGGLKDARIHDLRKCDHIAVVSFGGPLNFASSGHLETGILNVLAEMPRLRHLLVIGSGISEIDATGEDTLRRIVENVRAAGCAISFSGLPDQILGVLKSSHLHSRIGAANFFPNHAAAIATLFTPAHAGSDEKDCPYRRAMPPVIELSLHPDGSFRNAENHGLRLCRHIAVLRFDGPLVFANTEFLEYEILNRVSGRPGLRHVILVSHGISDIDTAGAKKLGDLVQRLRANGYAISFSGLREDVMPVLEKARVAATIRAEGTYSTQYAAVAAIHARTHSGSSETDCPLRSVAPRLTELSLHDDGTLRNIRNYGLRTCENLGVLRMDGPMVFSDPKSLTSEFINWAKNHPRVSAVVFSAHVLSELNEAEAGNLLDFIKGVREAGYRVSFAGLPDSTFESLARREVIDGIGVESFFATDHLAITAAYAEAHAGRAEADCPLRPMMPKMAELSLSEDGSLRDARRRGLALCRRIAMVRFDGSLNFSSFGYFESELRTILERKPEARHIIIAGHTLSELESTAAGQLATLIDRLKRNGYTVSITGLRDDILELAHRSGLNEVIGAGRVFPTQRSAIDAVHAEAHQGSDEGRCPLREVVRAGDAPGL